MPSSTPATGLRFSSSCWAAPSSSPATAQRAGLEPTQDEFRRVSFAATYQPRPDAMVYSSGSAVRDDVAGPGTWAFLPARLASGETVVINTGFVQNTMQDRSVQDRAVRPLIAHQPVMLTGYMRFPEKAGMLTPAENPAKRLWFTRDHLAMARPLGCGGDAHVLAPFSTDLAEPGPRSGVPKPGPLEGRLQDAHMQYPLPRLA